MKPTMDGKVQLNWNNNELASENGWKLEVLRQKISRSLKLKNEFSAYGGLMKYTSTLS